METRYEQYLNAGNLIPADTLIWNLYGAGLENMGREGQPESGSVPEPGDHQLLVRIDTVSLCFSDIKIIRQGSSHPKLYGRDLSLEPTRLGHEVALTVVKAGKDLADRYYPGQRLAMQPDIFQQGKSTAYGYTIPGGLVQYHLIGPEVLVTDTGECLLPVENMSYAAASMLEPWACVFAAYTQRRRLEPKSGGVMWIHGDPHDVTPYTFSRGLDAPALIVLTRVPESVRHLAAATQAKIVERDVRSPADYESLAAEFTAGAGFDDIVLLAPAKAEAVSAAAQFIARRGTLNLVGTEPLDDLVNADVGRLHYDYIAFLGNRGPDIAASYGEARNRCDLVKDGTALFLGAGGPMGHMHVQRALEAENGPRHIIATEVNHSRLEALKTRLTPIAEKNGRSLYAINPAESSESPETLVKRLTQGRGADDIVLCVPVASLVSEAACLLSPDGMLVLFAGMPNGTLVPLDLSSVYLHNAQYTGTSGLSLEDQAMVMRKAASGSLSPDILVAAVGGMQAAKAGYDALIEGSYAGKIVIFPQLPDLPLMSVEELAQRYPNIGAALGPNQSWTVEAERLLIEEFWQSVEPR
jgi:L-sorbose 1-phosphate reductase